MGWRVLDELALRKESFTEGTQVRLGDGQEWTFREPVVCFRPEQAKDGFWYFGPGRRTFGNDYESLLSILAETEDANERYNALLGLAVLVLAQNYTLTPAEVATLLPMEPGNPANVVMWNELVDVVTGNYEGKALAAGSQQPLSPTESAAPCP